MRRASQSVEEYELFRLLFYLRERERSMCLLIESFLATNIHGEIKLKNSVLIAVPKGDAEFSKTEKKFLSDWIKPNAQGVRVEEIYNIILSPTLVNKYKEYKKKIEQDRGDPNEKILYHGTDHSCAIINSNIKNMLCKTDDCAGCGIIMNNFDIKKAKALPTDPNRTCRIMFVTKVILGNMWQPSQVDQNAHGPPEGYDSTWGRV
ncbi:31688_t:CDS:2, partial [Racocetra persica]